jgi:hypothetical protein
MLFRSIATYVALALACLPFIGSAAENVKQLPATQDVILVLRQGYSPHEIVPLVREWADERPDLMIKNIKAIHSTTDEIRITQSTGKKPGV